MTSELTIIIVSLGGLILIATVSLGVLILTQFRTSRRDFNEQLTGIRSGLRDATREIGKNRDRIAQVEVSLGDRIAQVEASLGDRIARVEGTLDVLRHYFVGKGREVV